MKTLLEKAQEIEGKYRKVVKAYNREHYDLAIAYLLGEISLKQLAGVLTYDIKGGSAGAIYFAMSALKDGIDRGEITVKIKLSKQ